MISGGYTITTDFLLQFEAANRQNEQFGVNVHGGDKALYRNYPVIIFNNIPKFRPLILSAVFS